MGRMNISGLKVKCPNPNCGYVWFYSGNNPVTSCPRCGYRVRAYARQQIRTPEGNNLIPERRNERLI